MISYDFSLEKVLKIREDKEKCILQKFGNVQRELEREKKVLRGLSKELEEHMKNIEHSDKIQDLIRHYNYKEMLKKKIEQQTELIDNTTIELEELRGQLISAQKDRKILENFKERDYQQYLEEVKKVEQKQLDEVRNNRFKQFK